MTEPTISRRSPMRVAIIVLAVAVVATAAFVGFLISDRDAPTALLVPTPSTVEPPATPLPSETPTSTAPMSPAPQATTPEPSISQPAVSTPASVAPSSTAPPEPAAGQTMMWEGKASFEHFTVELLQDDPIQDDEMIEGKAGLPVEVCVAKSLNGADTVRVSSEPWTLQDSNGNVQRPQNGGYEPAFPSEIRVSVGECVSGFLTFDYVSGASDYANLIYENGLGDRAVWQFH